MYQSIVVMITPDNNHQSIAYLGNSTCKHHQVKKITLPLIVSTLFASLSIFNIQQVSAKDQVVQINLSNASTVNLIANAQSKPRIAVLDFSYSSIAERWFWWLESNAKGVSDILVNKLVEGGNFVVVERSQIESIIQEQNLGDSGRIDASTAAKIGKILGVDAVVIGSITGFNLEEDTGGVSIPFVGRVGGGQTTANVKLNVRLVNTSTAEILFAAQGDGQSNNTGGSINIGRFGLDSSSRKEAKLLTVATVNAIEQVAQKINSKYTAVASTSASTSAATSANTTPSANALVADISGKTIILNKGLSDGYRQGMKLTIERVSKQVKDPATGKVIRQITKTIGTIQITEADAQSSVAKIISGVGFKVGDMAKPAQ